MPTQATEEYFNRGSWGYDGTQWRKLPITWGYTDVWQDSEYVANAAAGTYLKAYGPVPAGQVWVAMAVLGADYTTNPTQIRFGIGTTGPGYLFTWTMAPGASVPVVWNGAIPLNAGQYLYVQIGGVVLNDDVLTTVMGYKMAVE